MTHVAQCLLTHGSLTAVRSFPHCSWSGSRPGPLQLIQFWESPSNQSGSSQWALIRDNSVTDPAIDFLPSV